MVGILSTREYQLNARQDELRQVEQLKDRRVEWALVKKQERAEEDE